jgi:hypothetical protein
MLILAVIRRRRRAPEMEEAAEYAVSTKSE